MEMHVLNIPADVTLVFYPSSLRCAVCGGSDISISIGAAGREIAIACVTCTRGSDSDSKWIAGMEHRIVDPIIYGTAPAADRPRKFYGAFSDDLALERRIKEIDAEREDLVATLRLRGSRA